MFKCVKINVLFLCAKDYKAKIRVEGELSEDFAIKTEVG